MWDDIKCAVHFNVFDRYCIAFSKVDDDDDDDKNNLRPVAVQMN